MVREGCGTETERGQRHQGLGGIDQFSRHSKVYTIWRDFLALGISAGMLMARLVYKSWCLSSTKEKCTSKKHSKKPAGPGNRMKEWLVLAEVAQRPSAARE